MVSLRSTTGLSNRCDASGMRWVTFNDPGNQRFSQCPSLWGSFHPSFLQPKDTIFFYPLKATRSLIWPGLSGCLFCATFV